MLVTNFLQRLTLGPCTAAVSVVHLDSIGTCMSYMLSCGLKIPLALHELGLDRKNLLDVLRLDELLVPSSLPMISACPHIRMTIEGLTCTKQSTASPYQCSQEP